MGFFKSTKGSIISDYFKAMEPIGQIKVDDAVDVALYDDHLEMKAITVKSPVTLKYDQITDIFYGYQDELIEKDKSVIGRAVAGGLLFGSAGLVVGAISGVGSKKRTVKKLVFVISYKSSAGEDAFLQFEDSRHYRGKKVAAKLRELCNIPEEDKDAPVSL